MNKNAKEPFVDIFIFQAIIVCIALIIVIGFKFLNGNSYNKIKKFYNDEILDEISVKDVIKDYQHNSSELY